jgi:hypothetical protein
MSFEQSCTSRKRGALPGISQTQEGFVSGSKIEGLLWLVLIKSPVGSS